MMKGLRFWWWLIVAFVSKHLRVIILTTLIGTTVALMVPRIISKLPRLEQPHKIGMVGRYRTNEFPKTITNKISSGLTKIDSSGLPQPALATSWTMNNSGTEYTFILDSPSKWHDGTPVKSQDIQLAIENVKTEVIDDNSIKFTLPEPFSPFPALLSEPIFKSGFIGTGNWRVKSIKKNGDYVEIINMFSDQGKTEIYRFYRTNQEVILALKLGEIDTILDATSLKDIPAWPQLTIESVLNRERYLILLFNTKDNSLSEKSFRQALIYAIPKSPSDKVRAMSPIPPTSWAYNPQVKPYHTDVNQTIELLNSTFAGKDFPEIELTTLLPYIERADEIAKAWTDAGVKTTVKVTTFTPDDFQVLLVGQQMPPDPDQYVLWHSTQVTNITGYSSPKVDKLLEDGRKTMDHEKRKEIYRDFQRFLVEDSPATFLEYITTYNIYRNR